MMKKLGKHILIEKITSQENIDRIDFINHLGSNPNVCQWVGNFDYHILVEQHRKKYYYYIVYVEDKMVGLLAIDLFSLDQKIQAMLIYIIDEVYQGRKYGQNILAEISFYLFHLGVEQINLYIDSENIISKHIAIKNGYQQKTEKRYIKVKK